MLWVGLQYAIVVCPDHTHLYLSLAVVYLLLSVALMVCGGLVLGLCFVLQYIVSFLVLLSSCLGRESWLLYFCCVLMSSHCFYPLTLPDCALDWSVVCYCRFPGHTYILLNDGPAINCSSVGWCLMLVFDWAHRGST